MPSAMDLLSSVLSTQNQQYQNSDKGRTSSQAGSTKEQEINHMIWLNNTRDAITKMAQTKAMIDNQQKGNPAFNGKSALETGPFMGRVMELVNGTDSQGNPLHPNFKDQLIQEYRLTPEQVGQVTDFAKQYKTTQSDVQAGAQRFSPGLISSKIALIPDPTLSDAGNDSKDKEDHSSPYWHNVDTSLTHIDDEKERVLKNLKALGLPESTAQSLHDNYIDHNDPNAQLAPVTSGQVTPQGPGSSPQNPLSNVLNLMKGQPAAGGQ